MKTPPPDAPPADGAFCVFCLTEPIADSDDGLVVVPGGFLCPFCSDALRPRPCAFCTTVHDVADNMTWAIEWGHA